MITLSVELSLSYEELNIFHELSRHAQKAKSATMKQMGEAAEKLIIEALEELQVYTESFSRSIKAKTAPDGSWPGPSDDA